MKRDLVIVLEVDEKLEGPDGSSLIKRVLEKALPGDVFMKAVVRCQCSKPYGTHALGCPIRDL